MSGGDHEDVHRDDEAIVELIRLPAFEASVVTAKLNALGIKAFDNTSTTLPVPSTNLVSDTVAGFPVYVFESDVATAREILSDPGAELEPDADVPDA